jgi:hypothetical protein
MAETSQSDVRWKSVLLVLCSLALAITFFGAADNYGLGGRPWYGWWDANTVPVGSLFVTISKPVAGGASARGGLRDGDTVDLREQSEATRVALLYQLMATQPTMVRVHRGASTLTLAVTGSTIWEGESAWKLATIVSVTLANLWFVGCAFLIALRRSAHRDGRLLALVLLCIAGLQLNPDFVVVPSAALQLVLSIVARACLAGALLLLLRLASQFGKRSLWRSALEWTGVAATLAIVLNDVIAALGIHMLWIDPTPFVWRMGTISAVSSIVCGVLVILAAIAAVATTNPTERPRAAWTLLPLPIAIVTWTIVEGSQLLVFRSWFAIMAMAIAADATWLLGSWIVTYALLKRRVLDFEFVLNRTLVVGTVSAIVVASFVLLEWLLGTVLAGVSHATGLIANGALALTLGLSLNPIHKRVDTFIDAIFFRKRHEDERALLDFSKEAAYVTDPQALLDQAVEKLQDHTDARGAVIFLDGSGAYETARSYGDASREIVGENDPAILALKTWHKPVDPHHYKSAMHGALVVPMLARGRLLGVVALNERSGGEAYAPDEIEALSQFAHGVGSALDVLSVKQDDSIASLRGAMTAMAEAIAALGIETASLRAND